MFSGADLNLCTSEGDSTLYLATYGALSSKQPWNTELLELLIASGELSLLSVWYLQEFSVKTLVTSLL